VPVQLDDLVGHLRQQRPVMGDEHEPAGALR
jgi:hypothetical protein